MNTMNRAQFTLNNIEECALCVHPFLGGGGKMLVVNTHTHIHALSVRLVL